MTIWTRQQISQASALRAKQLLDPVMVERDRLDVIAETRRYLARAFVHETHPYAIEVHEGDLQFREIEQDDGFVRVECAWRPETNEVELRGGPRDGELAWRDVGQPIRIPVIAPIDWSDPPTEPTAIGHHEIRYVLGGWNEETRRWVYDLEGSL